MKKHNKFKKGDMVALVISGKRYVGQYKGMAPEWKGEAPTAYVAFPTGFYAIQLFEYEVKLSRLIKV